MRGLRPGLQILDRRPLAPLRDRLRVDPQLTAQRRERSLRSLYCCSDGVRGRGAPMTNLSHTASFHSDERITPSNRGIKHLGDQSALLTARSECIWQPVQLFSVGQRKENSGRIAAICAIHPGCYKLLQFWCVSRRFVSLEWPRCRCRLPSTIRTADISPAGMG